MSREIKFRAWDKEDNKMWKVVSITESVWGDCEEAHIRVCEFHENPSKKETDVRMSVDYELMQYTGLKDRNRCEVYEGDIVLCKHWQSKFKVVFEAGMFRCRNIARGYEDQKVSLATFFGEVGCTVIGNIYENPELLEATA